MTPSETVDQIREFFGYLFDDFGFRVISETHFESFSNWVVVLQSEVCRIRIFRDRGEVSIAVGPLWLPPGWQAGPWFDLTVLISFLTNGKYTLEHAVGDTSQQLKRLADVFHLYYDQVCELFQEQVFQQKKGELELFREQMNEQIWNRLTAGKER
jgi:hypothetical protein